MMEDTPGFCCEGGQLELLNKRKEEQDSDEDRQHLRQRMLAYCMMIEQRESRAREARLAQQGYLGMSRGNSESIISFEATCHKEVPSGTSTSSSYSTCRDTGKKRGKTPKSGDDERSSKKPRGNGRDENDDSSSKPPSGDPTSYKHVKKDKIFLQIGHCFNVAPHLEMCRDCSQAVKENSEAEASNICRFYKFRKLEVTARGQLAVAGFSDPFTDPTEEDVHLWLPDVIPGDLKPEMANFLLSQVGDQFCHLYQQEMEAQELNRTAAKKIVWKQFVPDVREICDVCKTTLFNFHWACNKCGFVVCIDCFKGHKASLSKVRSKVNLELDAFSWLFCTDDTSHERESLMLTQVIAGDALSILARRMHEARVQLNIPQLCACPFSKELFKDSPVMTNNGSSGSKPSTCTVTAEVKPFIQPDDKSEESSSDSEDGNRGSSLRELLIRPSREPSGNCGESNTHGASTLPLSTTPAMLSNRTSKASPTSGFVTWPENEKADMKLSIKTENKKPPSGELKNFVRRTVHRVGGTKQLPPRVMTNVTSREQYPDVPHQWQCDGKLLILQDSACRNNYKIFQDQWKRGQPVMVLAVTSHLNKDLWHPDKFAKDFGDEKADLINCMSGLLVPNTVMRLFWEGFESHSKRLKDKQGVSMLLKLKDWPPSKDFADILPAHMEDLMNALPLGEYTQRTGTLNLASRLPKCFVRPDLGPKMYNAYGSALHPDKGTTNLHLDMSDAVNVMVYAGCPKDVDNEENMKAALRSVDEAGCDILTRRRVREEGVVPGALWHIYNARDADKIRDLLNKVAIERGQRLEPHHDPIHDQSSYLDGPLRKRLYKEYSVEGYAIVQCLGDAIFVPAGAPHQVRNLHNCIKVAEDFVSPENVSHCFQLTQEFRDLSDIHTNHEDKLQIKNIMYHAVKDSLAVLRPDSPAPQGHLSQGQETKTPI